MQKAEIVEMVQMATNTVTLAIGDGANDVAMIQVSQYESFLFLNLAIALILFII